MAIKAGQILHVANQFVVDRIQTGGPGTLNIPQEKVYELGNYQSVGIVRDVPDLTFSLESLNVDTEVEALLTGSTNPLADAAGTAYDLLDARPMDITSPWKSPNAGANRFKTVHGVSIPALTLESASWRFGLTENAGQTFSLRGDSIFYVPGVPYQDIVDGGDAAIVGGTYQFGSANGGTPRTALLYVESGVNRYALSVTVRTAAGDYHRLVRGTDYTDAATGVTFTGFTPAAGDTISITYGVGTQISAPTLDTQEGASPFNSNEDPMHQGTSVKPAAIRGKDIDVFFSTAIEGVDLGSGVGAPHEVRWPDVQSATIDWGVTLEEDREFGNYYAISREATDVPNVNGSIEIKPRSVAAFYERLRQVSGVDDPTRVMGPNSTIKGALRIELRNPESGGSTANAKGEVLKTHYVPNVQFQMPGYQGTVQQKLTTTLSWESDTGEMLIYKGARP